MLNHEIDNEVKIQVLFYISISLKILQVIFITKISEFQLYKLKKKQLIGVGREFKLLPSSFLMYKMHLSQNVLPNVHLKFYRA